jgi:hypothetical protein
MKNRDLTFSIADLVLALLSPLRQALLDETAFSEFLRLEFGWDLPANGFAIEDVRSAIPVGEFLGDIDVVFGQIESSEVYPDAQTYAELLFALKDVAAVLSGEIGSTPAGIPSGAWSDFSEFLMPTLVVRHLQRSRTVLLPVLLFSGIVEYENRDLSGVSSRASYVFKNVIWEKMSDLLNPGQVLATEYGWGGASLDTGKLLNRLGSAFLLAGFDVQSSVPSSDWLDLYYSATNPARPTIKQLTISLVNEIGETGSIRAEFAILPIPASGDPADPPGGVAIRPLVIETGGGPGAPLFIPWAVLYEGFGELPEFERAAVEIRPGQVNLRTPAGTPQNVKLLLAIQKEFNPRRTVLGTAFSHRVEIGEIKIELSVSGSPSDPRVELVFSVTGGNLVLDLADLDSFVRDSVGDQRQKIEFDVGIVWSFKDGLHIRGSAGLRVDFAKRFDLGPFAVTRETLFLEAGESGTSAGFSCDLELVVGPVRALVSNVGAVGRVVRVGDGQGTGILGGADIDLDFLPPTGVGLFVNSGPVTGGGFLTFGADRYTGALQLKVNQIAMSAFGVIDTKLPEGQDGFSFVILISAEFQPIQLGLGFTLNGVGGLAGINRTVDVKALQDVVRRGTMDKLLFPKKPAEDAAEIISTLSDVFPPAKDRHVFGPMAKIGWGSPTLIEGRLGLLLEVPEPQRLTLLGTISAALPKKKQGALVKLNMDVLGVLDFGDKSLAIDAQLRDSNAGGFPISGDMAMRLRWGDQPNFALSVGGLNPNFEAPVGFPTLERVRIDLGQGDNPSIGVDAYLAITSNTAQIGARAELNASGAGIKLHGWLGFDALFIFTPFQFVAEIDAGVRVSFHGVGKTITLRGQLSGPGPYRIKGKVCVSVAFWDACLSFDKSFGESRQISAPEVDPWVGNDDFPGLGTALADLRNWQAEPPAGTAQVVSLRTRTRNAPPSPGQPGDEIGVDPLGTATFRQRVVPLNQEITRFGAVPLKEPRFYKVASVTMPNANASAGASVQEFFAPAQYRTMKDAERISAPSFEPMDAGFKLAGADHAEGPRKTKDVTYKTSFIGTSGTTTYTLPGEELPKLTKRGAAVRAGIDATDLRRFVDRTVPRKVTIAKTGWVIGLRKTMQRVPTSEVATNYSTAAAALAKLIAGSDSNRQQFGIFPGHEIDANEAP